MNKRTPITKTASSFRPTVCVVDPDKAERERLRRLLGMFGVEAATYLDAEDFLARRSKDRPGCLVTEADLPVLSGLELLSRLRKEGLDVPVIVMARNGDVETAVRAMRAGAVDFFEKPFVERVLLQRIFQVLSRPQKPRPDSPLREEAGLQKSKSKTAERRKRCPERGSSSWVSG